MMRPSLTILSVGHADSPQFRERTARLVQLGHRVVEVTGGRGLVAGAGAVVPRGLPLRGCWRLIALSRVLHSWTCVQKLRPDVVLVHYAQGLWAWTAPLFGRPLAVSVMGGDVLFDEQGQPDVWNRAATRGLLRTAGLLLCKTAYLARRAAALGAAGRIETFPWGTDDSLFRSREEGGFREHHRISPDALVVFSPRAMESIYNTLLIVRAFARSGLAGQGARLVLSTYKSHPGYEAEVRQACAAAGLGDAVLFLPPQDARGMAAAYAASDICVSVPRSDGLPQTIFEATGCGASLLLADIPHYRGLFRHRESAWLSRLNDNDVAEGLCSLAANPAWRRQLVKGARKVLDRQTEKGSQSRLDDLLRRASRTRRPGWSKRLAQMFWLLAVIARGAAAARTGQPVFVTCGEYFRNLFGKGW